MSSYNRIILLGNMTRDPQLSYLPNGTPAVDFGIATNRKWTGQDGQQRDEICFVDCRLYGKRAEVVQRYFKKGNPIFVEGRLTLDSWTAQDGTKKSKHRVSVDNFEFVGGAQGGGQSSGGQPADDGGYGRQAPQGGGYGGGYNAPAGGQPQQQQYRPQQNVPPMAPPMQDPSGTQQPDDSFDPDDIPF